MVRNLTLNFVATAPIFVRMVLPKITGEACIDARPAEKCPPRSSAGPWSKAFLATPPTARLEEAVAAAYRDALKGRHPTIAAAKHPQNRTDTHMKISCDAAKP